MKLRSSQRGLTLLETLVTLVIVAIVAGLMSEGLFQLGRIEQRLGTGQLQAQLGRLHVLWVQQALEGLLPGAQDGPEQFRGSPKMLAGVSSLLPYSELQGPVPMQLSLSYRPESFRTELVLSFGAGDKGSKSVVLAQWPGEAGSFSYLDQQGQWLQDWPPSTPDAPLLPLAIAVRSQDDVLLLVAAPQATAQSLGKHTDLDKLP